MKTIEIFINLKREMSGSVSSARGRGGRGTGWRSRGQSAPSARPVVGLEADDEITPEARAKHRVAQRVVQDGHVEARAVRQTQHHFHPASAQATAPNMNCVCASDT